MKKVRVACFKNVEVRGGMVHNLKLQIYLELLEWPWLASIFKSPKVDCSPFLRAVCTLCLNAKSIVAGKRWLLSGNVHFFFAQRASTQPHASMLACVAVPTVAGGGVNFVRDIVDMVPHASRGNGHTATKQDQIPTIWAVGKLESVY
jgi:hypothetical protein